MGMLRGWYSNLESTGGGGKFAFFFSVPARLRLLSKRLDRTGGAEPRTEADADPLLSNVATILVQKGTLTSGSSIVAGTTWAKVRQMQDSSGRSIRSASPGTPVSVTGWKDLPSAGDELLQAPDEDSAKRAISNRLRDLERKKLLADVESINEKRAHERKRLEVLDRQVEKMKADGKSEDEVQIFLRDAERKAARGIEMPMSTPGQGDGDAGAAEGLEGKKELRLVIKADVSGTVEAVVGSLEHIGNKEAGVKVVGTGVGEVGESDVRLAEASDGEFGATYPLVE